MYDELIAELRQHHCDAKEDDTQEVCEECAYDVIIADKSAPSGIASVCVCGLMNRAADALDAMIFVVREQKAALDKFPRWIPVTEQLPKIHTMVLVMDKAHDMAVGSLEKLWDGEVWVCPFADVEDEQCPVTHWMPLPEPPKEET